MKREKNLLENIKIILQEKKMTIKELEERAEINPGTINTWNKKFPSIDKIDRVGEILGKSSYFLVNGEELPEGTIIIMGDNGREVLTGEKAKKFLKIFEELSSKDNQEEN